MKKKIVGLFLALLSNILHAQIPSVKQWDYRFGGLDYEGLTSFEQTFDDGFILGGYSFSNAGGDKSQHVFGSSDYWIVKLNSNGIKQWDLNLGGLQQEQLNSVLQLPDGSYILVGASESDSSGDRSQSSRGSFDFWIIKIDFLGNKIWDKALGGNLSDAAYSIKPNGNLGFLIAGSSASDSSGEKSVDSKGFTDYWIVRIDSNGNKQWDRSFGGNGYDFLYKIVSTQDGGYILAGSSTSDTSIDKSEPSFGIDDYWIIKIDSTGTKQWDKVYGGSESDYLWAITPTSDTGYVLGGISYSNISGNKTTDLKNFPYPDYWIIKVDSIGNKVWEKDIGGIDIENHFSSIMETSDKGFLLLGNSYSNIGGDKTQDNLGDEQCWVVKIDSAGTILWDKTILTNGHNVMCLGFPVDSLCYAFATIDNGGIGGDKSEPAWNNSFDYWIVKFCDSVFTSSVVGTQDQPKWIVSPNPFSAFISISSESGYNEIDFVRIYNSLGTLVCEEPIKSSFCKINLSFLPEGIFTILIQSGSKIFAKKMQKH